MPRVKASSAVKTATGLADVVRHDREVGCVGVVDERVDQRQRCPDQAEAAHHDGVARPDLGDRFLRLPPTVMAEAVKAVPQSRMQMGFWGEHGRWILLALLLGSLVMGWLERRRRLVMVRAPGA